jgi:hypothetical protein
MDDTGYKIDKNLRYNFYCFCTLYISSPFSVEVKNAWSFVFTPPYVFMARCLSTRKNYLYLSGSRIHATLLYDTYNVN